jgi:hypothetical protein
MYAVIQQVMGPRIPDTMPDVSNDLFCLVLLLEQFCDNGSAQDDNAKCRKNFSDTRNNSQESRVQGQPCEEPEQDRASNQRKER